jgi:hypothetical protein
VLHQEFAPSHLFFLFVLPPWECPTTEAHAHHYNVYVSVHAGMPKPSTGELLRCVVWLTTPPSPMALYAITVKNRSHLPIIDELLGEIFRAAWFTKLDMRAGYHQFWLYEQDESKRAFQTHNGHFEFQVMHSCLWSMQCSSYFWISYEWHFGPIPLEVCLSIHRWYFNLQPHYDRTCGSHGTSVHNPATARP